MISIKKIVYIILIFCALNMPMYASAMTEAQRNELIVFILQKIIVLQQQLAEMIAKEQLVAGNTKQIETKVDNIAPTISLEKWSSTTIASFKENDWCDNGGIPCGLLGINSDYKDQKPSSGIDKISYFIDGVLIGTTFDGNKVAWDTKNYINGQHKITAKVYDKMGNVGEDSKIINILNK